MINNFKKNAYLLMLLPALTISICVVFIPGIQTIYSSLTDWNGFAAEKHFIGFANYINLFQDEYFKIAI